MLFKASKNIFGIFTLFANLQYKSINFRVLEPYALNSACMVLWEVLIMLYTS
jgi:hypothetical protein